MECKIPSLTFGDHPGNGLNAIVKWPVAVIGTIPQTLLLPDRLSISSIPWSQLGDFLGPALTITALGAIESLLCGTVSSNMTGIRLQANQELIGQGIGNMIIHFLAVCLPRLPSPAQALESSLVDKPAW
jgi:SulP family sulfate permease